MSFDHFSSSLMFIFPILFSLFISNDDAITWNYLIPANRHALTDANLYTAIALSL